MSPWLKNQSDAVGDSSITRSRLRSESSRRKSARPTKNTRQNTPHTQGVLIFAPPKAPLTPRAIPHATCGPVYAEVTAPLASSTAAWTISPAFPHQIFTVQLCVFVSYDSSSLRPLTG